MTGDRWLNISTECSKKAVAKILDLDFNKGVFNNAFVQLIIQNLNVVLVLFD